MHSKTKIDSAAGELISKWYLRFNGYFTIDNFVVHAGDDSSRISNDMVGNHTEADILAIRHKFSREITGPLHIQNDPKIIDPKIGAIDFVIVEVKTGEQNRPNKPWLEKRLPVIEYILRFAGFLETEELISSVSKVLSESGAYHDKDNRFSIRLVLISDIPANKNWQHIANILFDDIVSFFVEVRGLCWLEENMGIASIHRQWDPLINEVFNIANEHSLGIDKKKEIIKKLIQTTV